MVRDSSTKKMQQQPEEESEEEHGDAQSNRVIKSTVLLLKKELSEAKKLLSTVAKHVLTSANGSSSSTKVAKAAPSVKKAPAPKPKLVKLGSGHTGINMSENASNEEDKEDEEDEEDEEIDEEAEFEESCQDFDEAMASMDLVIEDNCPADFFPITGSEKGTLIAYQFDTGPDICRIFELASVAEQREAAKFNVRFKVFDHDKKAFPSTFRPVHLDEDDYSNMFYPDDHADCKTGAWCVLKKKQALPTVTPARSKSETTSTINVAKL